MHTRTRHAHDVWQCCRILREGAYLLLLLSIKKVMIFANLIKLSVSESFADTFNLEITCLILLSHSPNIGPHCLTSPACLVWYTHKTPAQPRDSGRWLNQRIIRSTIFKPPQDWQIIIYTSTTKIFWEISAVSSLDLASCGLLVSAGLSGARGKTGIFLFLCMGQISTNMGEIFIYSVLGCDTDHQN